jgi:L-malate glycosyltransferase
MRVLYCSEGISGHNLRFLRKISSGGHDVVFCNFSAGHRFQSGLPEEVAYTRVSAKCAPDAAASAQRECLAQFLAVLESVKPDLVHAGPIPSVGRIAALSGFHPLVVMSWGSDILLDARRGLEWQQATRATLESAAGFVCDCDTVLDAARQYAPLPNSRVAKFPWGVTAGVFCSNGPLPSAADMPFDQESIRLICTRSWEPVYRIDLLLESFLLARMLEPRLRLILIGSGSESGKIHRFIERHNLRDVVLTPGKLDHAELPQWFRASSAYISCADSDGTSVSMLEAMATGLPVLVRDIPSNREWIRPEENGWLASDPDDFAKGIIRLCSLTPSERAAISERNLELVALRADWEANSGHLMELYAALAPPCEPNYRIEAHVGSGAAVHE